MKRRSFRVFFTCNGGTVESKIINAYTPNQAGQEVRKYLAGNRIFITKIKKLKG